MVVRDPVVGDIELTPIQTALLDTSEMQRLRGIKQLGTAYLVYPGCTHTRFEHSLGTLAVSRRIIDALRQAGHYISDDDAELVGMAALLHDIAHIPFGHTLEDERGLLARHDSKERLEPILRGGEVGQVLQRSGTAAAVVNILTTHQEYRSQIVAGSIDADLLDYLRRDSYYAGISQDYDDRLYRYFCLADGQLAVNLAKRGMDRPDARSEVLHLLRMRYFLTERVYLHHAKVAAGAMLSKAVESSIECGLSAACLANLSDEALLARLSGEWGQTAPDAKHLATLVRTRRLYKRAFGLSASSIPSETRKSLSAKLHSDRLERKRVESNIAARAGVDQSQVIVHCTGELPFRELTIPAYTRHGLHPLNQPPTGVLVPPDIAALENDYQALWRLWVFAPEMSRLQVGRAAEVEFTFANELRG
jgi:HD superfamily phosphohydrolase